MGADGVGAASDKGLMGAGKKNSWQMGDKGVTKDGVKVSGGGMDAGAVAGGAMDAAPAVMGLIDNIGEDNSTPLLKVVVLEMERPLSLKEQDKGHRQEKLLVPGEWL